MTSYVPPRDQDAWATFRGYAFQVDLTILRWLTLQLGEGLELECGEDIDRVTTAIIEQREVEQIKHLQAPISLRSPVVIEALGNALAHQASNPGMEISFRFTTTAAAGREQGSSLPGGSAALLIWEQLRRNTYPAQLRERACDAILSELRRPRSREAIPEGAWNAFQAFLNDANTSQMLKLIQRVEWSTGEQLAIQVDGNIRHVLMSQFQATDEARAQVQYQHLFVYLVKLLSRKGAKRLTVEDRTTQLAATSFEGADKHLLDLLRSRIESLEMRVNAQQGALAALSSRVDTLAHAYLVQATPFWLPETPTFSVPALTAQPSRRAWTVAELGKVVQTHTWTAVHGGLQCGKTQLGVLTVEALALSCEWLSFGTTHQDAATYLDRACIILAEASQTDADLTYGQACARLGHGALLVLDDLPRILTGSPLADRLVRLARSCCEHGVHMLTLSSFPLPTNVQEYLGSNLLAILESKVDPSVKTTDWGVIS